MAAIEHFWFDVARLAWESGAGGSQGWSGG
jgi:hypothetical protein